MEKYAICLDAIDESVDLIGSHTIVELDQSDVGKQWDGWAQMSDIEGGKCFGVLQD